MIGPLNEKSVRVKWFETNEIVVNILYILCFILIHTNYIDYYLSLSKLKLVTQTWQRINVHDPPKDQ